MRDVGCIGIAVRYVAPYGGTTVHQRCGHGPHDAEAATVATALPDVRALVAAGVVVPAFVVYVMIHDDDVEAFGVAFDFG